ncbi:hypothetical protein [Nocardioides limicola]|uniref:hypothetical protein n=1 Tax=Nocardioides limicola TaxID=2803368 RepID=UPI00193B1059|nr:hypothetical protein [Nocardioides sp. DJM-14]
MGLGSAQNNWIFSAIVHIQGVAEDGYQYRFEVSDRPDGAVVWTTSLVDGSRLTFTISSTSGPWGTLWIQPSIDGLWSGPRAVVSKSTPFQSADKAKWRAIGIASYLLTQLPEGEGFPKKKARKHFRNYLLSQTVFYPSSDGGRRTITEVVPTGYIG